MTKPALCLYSGYVFYKRGIRNNNENSGFTPTINAYIFGNKNTYAFVIRIHTFKFRNFSEQCCYIWRVKETFRSQHICLI